MDQKKPINAGNINRLVFIMPKGKIFIKTVQTYGKKSNYSRFLREEESGCYSIEDETTNRINFRGYDGLFCQYLFSKSEN